MTDEINGLPSPDLMGKIGSHFGVTRPQSATQDAEAEQVATDESVEQQDDGLTDLEFEGLNLRVPPKLKERFMQGEDYTRKTQSLAEHQRALDHAREMNEQAQSVNQFQESISGELKQLNVIDAYLAEAAKANWAGMNMEQIMRTKLELDNVKDQRAALEKTINEKRAKFQDEFKGKISELRAKSRELASKSIPNFNEETEKAIKQYAIAEGLSEAETDRVLLDPRSAKILWKASQFDKVRAGTGKATQATQAVRPGTASERMPPGLGRQLNLRKALNGAKNSGDKSRAIENYLAKGSIFNKGN